MVNNFDLASMCLNFMEGAEWRVFSKPSKFYTTIIRQSKISYLVVVES